MYVSMVWPMWTFWNQVANLGELACMALFLLAFLVIVRRFKWVCLLNLLVCLVLHLWQPLYFHYPLPEPGFESHSYLSLPLLFLPPTRTRVWIPFLLIFTSSISTPYLNQGLYPHPAMTGVQLVRGWGSFWLWKKRWLLWCEAVAVRQWWLTIGEWLWDSSDHCLASWRCCGPNSTKHWWK